MGLERHPTGTYRFRHLAYDRHGMHLRRVLILVAMVLLLTAVVVAITPPRRQQVEGAAGPPPEPTHPGAEPRGVSLRFPPSKRVPVIPLVPGDHVLVQVATAAAGQAALMGLTDTAEPGTPATFDVIAPGPARYAVTFTPAFGRPRRIATIEVKQ
jgi:hypothetical protein